jgi:hypothetical protein
MSNHTELKPIAFVVMPFRERPIPEASGDIPKKVNFDRLWDSAIQPALQDLGYIAIRADFDCGSIIVKDMLERLAFADLVLADLSIPNGNVYYEVGVRHVAQRERCIHIAANWSKQLFDVDQMRCLRYELKDGAVPQVEADRIRDILKTEIPKKRDSTTPYYELVQTSKENTVFHDQIEKISGFQAEVGAIRLETDSGKRKDLVVALLKNCPKSSLEIPEVVVDLTALIRDACSWSELIAFVDTLPPEMQKNTYIREQYLLGKSELGEPLLAIKQLEKMIETLGDTAERRGIIGGRWKRIWKAERELRKKNKINAPSFVESGYLDKAIQNYQKGMMLDLNEYYCAGNLPNLLVARGKYGDAEQAAFLDRVVIMTTRRKIDRGEDDGWARSTLLGAAFREANLERIDTLLVEVVGENPALWQLKSTLEDIKTTIDNKADEQVKEALTSRYDQLIQYLKSQ